MNQVQPAPSNFDFVDNQGHIYNILTEDGFYALDFGWAKFEFELHAGLKLNGNEVDGITEFDVKKIKLEMALSDSEARETIMHEIMHIILESVGLDERLFDGEFIKTTNEVLANTLAKQLRLVDRLNPGFLTLLYSNV